MTEQELNKACAWLKENYREFWGYIEYDDDPTEMFDLFRKAMTAKTNPLFEQTLANVNPDTRAEVRKNMEFLDKACEVIDQFCEGLEPHRRNFTIEDFRKAMTKED